MIENPDIFLVVTAAVCLITLGNVLRAIINWERFVTALGWLILCGWLLYRVTERFDPLPDLDRIMYAGMSVWGMILY